MIKRIEHLDSWQIVALAKAHREAIKCCAEEDKKYHESKFKYFRSLCADEMFP
jgi:hypothetical protein